MVCGGGEAKDLTCSCSARTRHHRPACSVQHFVLMPAAPMSYVRPHHGTPSQCLQLEQDIHITRRPEIQATVKAPAVRNFRMAVTLYYIFAMSLWILVTVIGYW